MKTGCPPPRYGSPRFQCDRASAQASQLRSATLRDPSVGVAHRPTQLAPEAGLRRAAPGAPLRCAREQIATLEEKMAIAVVATIGPTLGIVCRRRRGSAKGTCCSASARGRPTDRWPARGHRSSPRVWHRGSGRRQSCGRCSAKRRIMRAAPTTPSTRRRERRRHAAGPRPSYVTLVRWCHAVQAREVAGDVACGSDKEDASQSSAANAVLPLTRRHAARTASAAALASLVAANC